MKSCKFIVIMLMLGSIIMASIPTINSEENSDISVEVMIDFGDGIVEWAEVDLSMNRTAIKATELACEQLDLNIVASWSTWGVFVYEIGGIASPPDWSWWWEFLIWNDVQYVWESSMVGASDLELEEGSIIGWHPNSSTPGGTPSMKYPWTSFQHDALNLGSTKDKGPSTNSVLWVYDTETLEMPSSPVIGGKKVIVNNWGGVFCLNEEGDLLWKNSEVKGSYSPAIGHGKVLVGGKDGYLYALNLSNGGILWKTMITSHPGLSGVTSPPTIINGKVFLGSFNFSGGTGYLYCLDEDNGNVLWRNTTFSSVHFSSPSISEDRVYVGTMGLYNSTTLQWSSPFGLYAFDARNGEMIWNFSVEGSVGSSPTIAGDRVLFTSKDGYLYSLNKTNGNLIWKKNIGSSVSSPAFWQGAIFVGSGEMSGQGKFYSFDLEGNPLWEFIPNGAVQSSPAVAGNFVYFATNVQNGTIYCLNLSNGQLVWQFKPWPEQFIISSPAIVRGKVFIASDNGRLYCLGGNPKKITVDGIDSTEVIHVGEDVEIFHKDEENKLIITSIDANVVTLKIDSLPLTVEVNVGKTKKLDTDGNGKNDLSITVNNVNSTSQTASLTVKALAESQDTGMNVNPILTFVIIIIVISFIVLGITVNLKRRR
ncbi:MAG: PQQ-binding-like beta-propeller repeat protein [Thermoplasmata archaeon]